MDGETLNRKFQKELNAGASALVIMGLLARGGRAMYGYEIGKRLEELAGGAQISSPPACDPVRTSERYCNGCWARCWKIRVGIRAITC